MQAIVEALVAANPGVRIVANAITLETLGEILDCMRTVSYTHLDGYKRQLQGIPARLPGREGSGRPVIPGSLIQEYGWEDGEVRMEDYG